MGAVDKAILGFCHHCVSTRSLQNRAFAIDCASSFQLSESRAIDMAVIPRSEGEIAGFAEILSNYSFLVQISKKASPNNEKNTGEASQNLPDVVSYKCTSLSSTTFVRSHRSVMIPADEGTRRDVV